MRGRETETGRVKVGSYLLVHSLNACNIQGWPELKPGTRNSLQVSHVSHRSRVTLAIYSYLPGFSRKLESGVKPGILIWDMHILNTRPNAHSMDYFVICEKISTVFVSPTKSFNVRGIIFLYFKLSLWNARLPGGSYLNCMCGSRRK